MINCYVSPTGANTNAGTSPSSPWATLDYTQRCVRELLQNFPSEPITVWLMDGRHTLSDTLKFDRRDSGNVTWTGVPRAMPVISGATSVSTWTQTDAPKNIWRANLTREVRQVYIDGFRLKRARRAGLAVGAVVTSTGFTTTDPVTTYGNITDVELLFRQNWRESRLKVASASAGASLTMPEPVQSYLVALGNVWFSRLPTAIENAFEIFSANASPGTFYWDRTAGHLYIIPPTGFTDPNASEVLAPSVEKPITFDGTKGVKFQAMAIRHGTWLIKDGFADIQWLAVMELADPDFQYANDVYGDVTPGCIELRNAENISFTQCRIENHGSHGISVLDGCKNIDITHNLVRDNSGHGILIGRPRCQNLGTAPIGVNVTHNVVHDNAAEFPSALGICKIYGSNCRIENNEVAFHPYSGIGIGWGWGNIKYRNIHPNSANTCNKNFVQFNMQTLDDGAGIYSVGQQRSIEVSGNHVANDREAGLYLDQGATQHIVRDNLFEHCNQWLKLNQIFGDFTWGDNHSNVPGYADNQVPHDSQTAPPPGTTLFTYVPPITYNAALPTDPQLKIIKNAGTSANWLSNTNFSSWIATGVTVARSNVQSPCHKSVVYTLASTTASSNHYLGHQIPAGSWAPRTVYAKAGTATWLKITQSGIANHQAIFNLANGELTDVDGGTASIEHIGDQWYRCTYRPTVESGVWHQIYPGDTMSQVSGLSTFVGTESFIYITSAQIGNRTI